MGIVAKGAKCNVNGCNDDGVRSLNTGKVEQAGLQVSSTGKKTVLCKTHYKEWKKESKDDRDPSLLQPSTLHLAPLAITPIFLNSIHDIYV